MLKSRRGSSQAARRPTAVRPRKDGRTNEAFRTAEAGRKRPAWSAGIRLSPLLVLVTLLAACAKSAAPGAAPEQQPAPEPAPAAAPAPPSQDLLEESSPSDAGGEAESSADVPQRSRIDASDESDADDDLAQAERALAQADARLQHLAQGPPAQASTPPGAGAGAQEPSKRTASAAKDCETTCKAFASLMRARDAICRIAGQEHARCTRANDIVERREQQRAACACRE